MLLKYERRVHMWRDEEKEREEQWERDRECVVKESIERENVTESKFFCEMILVLVCVCVLFFVFIQIPDSVSE